MVAMDKDGKVLAAASLYPIADLSLAIAEALCLRWMWSFLLSWTSGEFNLKWFASNHAWRKCGGESYLIYVVHDCFSFLGFFDRVDFSFVRREGNSGPDFIAGNVFALSGVVWVEEGHSGLLAFLHTDVLASMPITV